MALIEIRDVRKTYQVGDQQIHALDGVDLDIREGEYAAIIGPSGSGKSTLMHLLGCLDRPTSGSLKLDGNETARASADELAAIRNRKIGFVFQSFNLLNKLDVLANIELPLIYSNIPAAERHRRARAAAERVGLSDRLHNRPRQLSGGQCQRVAIARALVNNPRLILADEPTGNLDSVTGANILRLFAELHGAGSTIVLVTHDQGIAAAAARRIQLSDGRIVVDTANPLPASAA